MCIRDSSHSVGTGDSADAAVRVLAIACLALPLLGIFYILLRLVRQLVTGLWQKTRGKALQRAAAIVAVAAVAAGLAWAWWPGADTYRPVQSYERGTLADATTVLFPAASTARMAEGQSGRTIALWPEGARMPTRDEPQLSMVLVPRQSGTARLNELWQEIAAYGKDLRNQPLSEIQGRLSAYKEQIMALIKADPSATPAGSTVTAPTPGATSGATPTPSPGASTGATPAPSPGATTRATPGATSGATAGGTPGGTQAPDPGASATTAPAGGASPGPAPGSGSTVPAEQQPAPPTAPAPAGSTAPAFTAPPTS